MKQSPSQEFNRNTNWDLGRLGSIRGALYILHYDMQRRRVLSSEMQLKVQEINNALLQLMELIKSYRKLHLAATSQPKDPPK